MKSFLCTLCVLALLFAWLTIPVSAQNRDICSMHVTASAFTLRAGGGSSGGGGGGSSGGSSGHTGHTGHTGSGSNDPISMAFGLIAFLLIGSGATVAYRFRLSKYAKNTKKLMALLQEKDGAWKYKHIQKQVRTTYFAVQQAWSNLDMLPAKQYMSNELYESFQTRLNWMKLKDQKNVLKHIRLQDAIPVSIHDNCDDSLDYVWFYIKGRMIDYTVDTQTNERIDGSPVPESFSEYWQFTRTSDNRWVLNQILQNDEADQIVFTTE